MPKTLQIRIYLKKKKIKFYIIFLKIFGLFMLKKNKIGIINHWPNLPNAERECASRIALTAKELGVEPILLDTFGRCLKTKKLITKDEIDFVISMHFSTPKCYDVFSYITLWNPLKFYNDWGYRVNSNNLLTYDDFLSCSSKPSEDHIKRLIHNNKTHLPPNFILNPSLSDVMYEPKIHPNSKIFYCGINWERANCKKGRFENFLKKLDEKNIIKFFGPKKLNGKKVWIGYKNYIKPIPFDGTSLIKEIADCGISLVLSSEEHIISDIASNRLYESAAAGAVIISNKNNFVKKHFKDSVLYIDTDKNTVFEQIVNHYNWIQNNPKEALKLSLQSQKIFKENFSLKTQLKNIFKNHENRKIALNKQNFNVDQSLFVNCIHIFYFPKKKSLLKLLDSFEKQTHKNFNVTIFVDINNYKKNCLSLDEPLSEKKYSFKFEIIPIEILLNKNRSKLAIGKIIRDATKKLKLSDLLHISLEEISIFSNHLEKLLTYYKDDNTVNVVVDSFLHSFFSASEGKEIIEYISLNNLSSLNKYLKYSMPCFIVKNSFFQSLPDYSIPYLDSYLLIYLLLLSKDFNKYTIKPTSIHYFNKKLPSIYDSEIQKQIIKDKVDLSFETSLDILENLHTSSLINRIYISKFILKHLPIKKFIRNLLIKIYKFFEEKRDI
ncbi:MAG: hypothetical protein K1060chlam5_00710 [Candidatus Anoxychlamydiales bacterium]|nr:hypothetical protein [Candidatus Anoxychlamydiales bacterium]